MIRKWINQYKQHKENKWIKVNNIPQYCIDILNILKEDHEVHYYVEEYKEYIADCYVIDGFIIKLDRMSDIITLSEEDLIILIDEIEDLLGELKSMTYNWKWKIT